MGRKLLAVTIGLVLAVSLGGIAKARAAGGPIIPGVAYGGEG